MKSKRNKWKIAICAFSLASVIAVGVGIGYGNVRSAAEKTERTQTGKMPVIEVQTDKYTIEEAPNAVPGKSYRIFDATATDSYGNSLAVTEKVYLYYNSENRSRIFVENGYVTPSFEGVYTVEYTAVDKAGMTATLTYDFHCMEKTPLKANVVGGEEVGLAGVRVTVGELQFENAIGETEYSATANLKGTSVSYTIDDSHTFLPMYAGEYEIVYEFADYNETGYISDTLMIGKNDTPIIFDEIVLPKYLIKDCNYTLPIPTAYCFADGKPVRIDPLIRVTYEDVAPVFVSADQFTATEEGKVLIEYIVRFNGKQVVKSYELESVEVHYATDVDMERYFYGEDIVTAATSYGVSLQTDKEGANVEFINKVIAQKFSLDFGFDLEENNYDRLDITLTDSLNAERSVKFSVVRGLGEFTELYVNDVAMTKSSVSFTSKDVHNLTYNDEERTVTLGGSEAVKVRKTLAGETFDGFESDYVYVRVGFADVEGNSKAFVYKINNQVLFNEGDGNFPHVVYTRYEHGKKEIGDLIELDRIYVGDILNPNYSVSYYVKGPDGSYVVDVNGTLLSPENTDWRKSYAFIATQLGKYNVVMSCEDSFGNSEMYSYSINIMDTEAPLVRIIDKQNETAKVGDVLTAKDVQVSDNLTQELVVYTYVMTPKGTVEEYKADKKFVLAQKGVYRVYYYVFDENGNTTTVYYSITVE